MKKVRLGGSELKVSPVCYGSWQLSPRFWGDQPRETMIAAMRRAFEVGVNFYDTANAYGDGLAETVMGEALSPLPRDEIVVATKVFWHFFPDGRRFGDLSKSHILSECDASLRRLQLDYIDLYQCHSFDHASPIEETAAAMDTLVKAGKIRAYGVSNFSVEQLRLAKKCGNFTTLQPLYNLLERSAERDILPYCHAEDVGTLVYSPLAKGLLTGKYRGDEKFADFRAERGMFQGEVFQELCRRIGRLAPLAEKYEMSITQLVIAATLRHPHIDVVIVGIKRPEHIEEAAAAAEKTLSHEDCWTVRSIVGTV
jgi:aryl-alcohol dehydrogenase-like predicted oxidoreductase